MRELLQKVQQLKSENAELRTKFTEIARTSNMRSAMIERYQTEIVPNYRSMWERADKENAELLQKVKRLELMLKLGAAEAAKGCCPYDVAGADAVKDFCNEMCEVDDEKPARCWIEYWGKLAEAKGGA